MNGTVTLLKFAVRVARATQSISQILSSQVRRVHLLFFLLFCLLEFLSPLRLRLWPFRPVVLRAPTPIVEQAATFALSMQ